MKVPESTINCWGVRGPCSAAQPRSTHDSTNSISVHFRQFSISGKCFDSREISESSENVVLETLFSVARANICRIVMKSTWLVSLNSEVLKPFYSSFVGPFAPDKEAKYNLRNGRTTATTRRRCLTQNQRLQAFPQLQRIHKCTHPQNFR